jgi:hydrogenase small subunit
MATPLAPNGACGGDSLAILSAESPSLEQLLQDGGVDLLWHPSLSHGHARRFDQLVDAVLAGEQVLDILCVEGSIITAPRGTGLCDPYRGRGKMDLVRDLAERAGVVVAMGTCAAFGACMRRRPTLGLHRPAVRPCPAGGLLAPDWRSRRGLPVINVAGCPAHPHTMTQTLAALALGLPLPLDGLNRPASHFSTVVHQGCTRNEYHEYDIEDTQPGDRACLFFNLGCQGR